MREHPFLLPLHCLYTDALFVLRFLPFVETVMCLQKHLYHYSLEQAEAQSTSRVSELSHLEDNYRVWNESFDFYLECYGKGPSKPVVLKRLLGCYKNAYTRTIMQPFSMEWLNRLAILEDDLRNRSFTAFDYMKNDKTVRIMRATRGKAYRLLKLTRKYRDE